MSGFSVITSELVAMHGRLGTISRDVEELHGQVGAYASAGAQTAVDGSLGELMGRWSAALPQFGQAGDSLQATMSGAAAAYIAADEAVGGAAAAS
jgi:hypothetical protein